MSSFTNALITEHQLDGMFRADLAFSFQLIYGNASPSVDIKKNDLSDLASVPWYLQWLVPKTGKYDQAAFVHDKLYGRHAVNCEQMWIRIDREYADKIFYLAMQVLDVAPWRAKAMYYAVRTFGKSRWNVSKEFVPPSLCIDMKLPELSGP